MSSFHRPLVVSGPSGVGKSTLLTRLFAEFPENFGFSVSHTTRAPRSGETNGKEYHFVSRERFLELLEQGAFIEHAEFSGNFYGTSFMAVHSIHEIGRRCILDIEAQGIRQVKETTLNPVYLFVSPPSVDTLKSRLLKRGSESDVAIQKRLKTAIAELDYATTGAHDFVIVNDNLDRAYGLFKKVALGSEIDSDKLPENLTDDNQAL